MKKKLLRTIAHTRSMLSMVLLISLCPLMCALAQTQTDSNNYRIIINLHAGVTESRVERSTTVDKAELSRSAFALMGRVLCQPDHLLALGLESGYMRFSTLRVKNDATIPAGTTMVLAAIPILAIASMEKYGVELSAGVGKYQYRVEINSNGTTTLSSQWEVGWCLGLGYRFALSRTILAGLETRYYAVPERSASLFSLGLRVQYQLWY